MISHLVIIYYLLQIHLVNQNNLEYKDIVLVFNGEIYNHMDLRKSLDYKFETETDTETLVVGLEKRYQVYLRTRWHVRFCML